ncbi:acetyltransferase (GNAT) family protein [Actinoplanes teichomyceticus]|uniref:Acetyltransferase (GNAT) family protein n=2 Tax=Actinoplanes teichomyceticus TaxID=1867 RepID=A0A561VGM9_ACTTI|nr:acetyltransferase (GNAT) family protein [Actinoplanes teichomyceticus]
MAGPAAPAPPPPRDPSRAPGRPELARRPAAVIRPFAEADWAQVWPIVRQVVRAADTYTYDPAMTEAQAREIWLERPPGLTVVAAEPVRSRADAGAERLRGGVPAGALLSGEDGASGVPAGALLSGGHGASGVPAGALLSGGHGASGVPAGALLSGGHGASGVPGEGPGGDAAGAAERIAGTAKMGPNRPGPGAHVATASFMVAAGSRGRGVGAALCRFVIDWARRQGYAGIQFNAVAESNTAAVGLYRRLGFQVIGTVPRAFEHPTRGRVGLHVMYLEF